MPRWLFILQAARRYSAKRNPKCHNLGVEVKLNTRMGVDVKFAEVAKDYDAFYVAIVLRTSEA